MTLSLAKALKEGRLEDFIQQQERAGVGPVDAAELDHSLAALIKPQQSEDRTSRSPSGDGSTEK